ncbi:MAG TPA: MBL fold metallo-hydrolase [Vicinamibacterales bacterium]|nr:MBL fold metallo-hydrolase [Vicinamibacterales bacterium]
MHAGLRVTYIGGPTAFIEFAGFRVVTDPTFDPAGTEYPTAAYTLHKTQSPAAAVGDLGNVDAVLLSHDHHFDNLDHAGRRFLADVPVTYTTVAGAERLGGRARGLAPWESVDAVTASGRTVRITATPARHGPAGGDRGPCLGFVLEADGSAVYVSGDTVWFDDVEEIGRRFSISAALLNMGAARVAAAGPHALTFTAADAVQLATAWPQATIVPLHFEGWQHFTESRADIERAFEDAGLSARLRWLTPGAAVSL